MKMRKIISLDEVLQELKRNISTYKCQHYKLKNEGNEGCGRCVKCGEEVRIY